jgi:hypothetical protein
MLQAKFPGMYYSNLNLDPQYSNNCNLPDGIFISRNVGGRVTPAMTDIMALSGFIKLASIVVIHHTGTLRINPPKLTTLC